MDTGTSRPIICTMATGLALFNAFLCFMSLMMVTNRDPWTAVAAGIVPILLIPAAIVSWKFPIFGIAASFILLVSSDLLAVAPKFNWEHLRGMVLNFSFWGSCALALLLLNAILYALEKKRLSENAPH